MGRLPVQQVLLADRKTRAPHQQRMYNGTAVRLLYIQAPRRARSAGGRRKSTWYIYEVLGAHEQVAYRNKGPQDWYYLPMGGTADQKRRYYDIFIRPPLTGGEKVWLDDHDYVQVERR